MAAALCLAGLFAAAPVWAANGDDSLSLPSSGLKAMFHDRIDNAPIWRFRYLAPALEGDGVEFVDVADDMEHLCTSHALPALRAEGQVPERIIMTLMSEPVEFGMISPQVRQFFESYSIENGRCIWEVF